MIPAARYQRDSSVAAIMIEVNRALYMDESTGEKLASIDSTAAQICDITRRVISCAFHGPPCGRKRSGDGEDTLR